MHVIIAQISNAMAIAKAALAVSTYVSVIARSDLYGRGGACMHVQLVIFSVNTQRLTNDFRKVYSL